MSEIGARRRSRISVGWLLLMAFIVFARRHRDRDFFAEPAPGELGEVRNGLLDQRHRWTTFFIVLAVIAPWAVFFVGFGVGSSSNPIG
jgi:hypothetical protein